MLHVNHVPGRHLSIAASTTHAGGSGGRGGVFYEERAQQVREEGRHLRGVPPCRRGDVNEQATQGQADGRLIWGAVGAGGGGAGRVGSRVTNGHLIWGAVWEGGCQGGEQQGRLILC